MFRNKCRASASAYSTQIAAIFTRLLVEVRGSTPAMYDSAEACANLQHARPARKKNPRKLMQILIY